MANTGSEFTTSLSNPEAMRPKIFFINFPTALTSIPTPRGGRSRIFAELGTASEEGGLLWAQVSAGWSPACPSPRLGHLGCQHLPGLCSEDGTTVRVMKAYSSSLQPNPTLSWPHSSFTCWDCRTWTLDELELSTSAPRLMPTGHSSVHP